MSYPEKLRYTKENQQNVIWAAKYGNEFYKMLLKDRDKFTLLNTPKVEQGLIRTLLMMSSMGVGDKEKVFKSIKKDFPKYFDMMKAFYDVDGLRMQRKPKEYLERLLPLIDKYNVDPKDHFVMIMSSALDLNSLSMELAERCLKYVKKEYLRKSMFDISAYAKLLWMAGRKADAKKFLEGNKKYLEENRSKKKFAKSFAIIDEILKSK